jgi:hypothetical protein
MGHFSPKFRASKQHARALFPWRMKIADEPPPPHAPSSTCSLARASLMPARRRRLPPPVPLRAVFLDTLRHVLARRRRRQHLPRARWRRRPLLARRQPPTRACAAALLNDSLTRLDLRRRGNFVVPNDSRGDSHERIRYIGY